MMKINIEKSYKNNSLILQIGHEPSYVARADSYYLFDFVCFADENISGDYGLQDGLIALIEFWVLCVKSLHKATIVFLPFDLSDEYIGGLLLVPSDNNKVNLFYVNTNKWSGCGINKYSTEVMFNEDSCVFRKDSGCLAILSGEELVDLLKQNIDKLKHPKENC